VEARRYYTELRGKRVAIAQLADGWGVSRKLMVRDFKRWCEMNGLDPTDFYERGFRLTGYWAPREFKEWWESKILPQYQRTGHARKYYNGKMAKPKAPHAVPAERRHWTFLVRGEAV